MTKSEAACRMSIDRLLEGRKCGYLWTFTFAETLDFRVAADRWCLCRKQLVRELNFSGVRVYELHPGGHGLHVHVVTASWYSARAVRRIVKLNGLGRIHAKRISGRGGLYIAKYLSKDRRADGLKGFRLWGCIGECKPVKVSSLMVVGHVAYCFARAKAWLRHNAQPMCSEDRCSQWRALRHKAMQFYARGEFEGYEAWKFSKLHFGHGGKELSPCSCG